MKANSTFFERYSLLLFLIITPLIGIAIPQLLLLPSAVAVLMVAFVPALMSVLLTALTKGGRGVAALLRKLVQWRVSLKWYSVALALPLGIQLSMSLLALILGWIPEIQLRPWSPAQLIIGILILILAILEELGWRGYALPKLLANRPALFSALLIGISWGAFHLGIGAMESRPLLPTFLAPFAASFVFTWLFIQTRGSLVIAILFHFGLNYFTFFNQGMTIDQVLWSQVIVTLALDLILILIYGKGLQRGPVEKLVVVDAGVVEAKKEVF